MEDDTDIYEDLPSVEIKLEENFVANQTESNTREYAELKKQIAELTTKLEDCRKVNENLEVNLASLLKTAKSEITRKDKMIDDLRKRLDDVTFKRGAHFRTNDRVCKPTLVDNVTICRQITDQISLPLSQNKHESAETDSSYNLTKNFNLSKSTLTPLTVFGERLLKRIAEEQSVEKRAKQPSRFGSNNSCGTTVEGYVVESDKENGSVTDVKPSRTKDIQFTTTNSLAEGKNEMDSNDIADIGDIADGGENNGSDRTMNVKCIKSEVKERVPRSTNKESCEDVNNVSDKKYEHTKARRIECSEKYSDLQFITYSNTERDRYSSSEQRGQKRTHRSSTVAVQPSEYDADRRIAKRHCKSAERLSITPDDYRWNSIEHRRIKQREDRRTTEMWEDRRLRRKQPFCESSRDEKYTRNKSNKYDSYRGRSARRYDINLDSMDGSKAAVKRESRDSRNIERSEKSARSMSKRSDRSEDYECQPKERLKDVDRRRINKSDGEKLMTRTRYCDTLKSEKAVDTNKCFERGDRRRFVGDHEIPTTTTTKVADVSRKHQIDRYKDPKTMDANEITLDPSICLSDGERRGRSQDRWTNGDKPESSVKSVDVTNTSIVSSAATATTNDCLTTVVSLDDQCCENIGNVENNETVENVENIEKFIRNYNSIDDNRSKNRLDERNDTSKIAKEHGSTTIHVSKGQTDSEKQRDTIRSDDLKSAEMDTKLEEVESKDALQQVSQSSAGNDTKENETTSVTSRVEYEKSNGVLESNCLTGLAADKESINTRTKGVLSNSNTICNISSSSNFQVSKPGCNVNGDVDGDGDDKYNNKDDDKNRRTNVSRDSKADKPDSNCDYSVPNITNGNDDDHDRNHESQGNIKVHKKTDKTDHNTVRDKERTSKDEGRANLAEKLVEKIETEESKLNREKKENGKAVTKQGSLETEKTSINCDGTNRRNTSMNVHGKLVVFARRKKPVCLANNNANMTVLINNSRSLDNSCSGASCTMKDNSLITIGDKRTAT